AGPPRASARAVRVKADTTGLWAAVRAKIGRGVRLQPDLIRLQPDQRRFDDVQRAGQIRRRFCGLRERVDRRTHALFVPDARVTTVCARQLVEERACAVAET